MYCEKISLMAPQTKHIKILTFEDTEKAVCLEICGGKVCIR